MESATRVYHKLSLVLHPDKHGGSSEHFVRLKTLHNQWEAADSRAGTVAVELQTARETASRAQAELAHLRHDWRAQMAASAVRAQSHQWYQHKLGQDMATMQKNHHLELESVRSKLKYASEQWQKCRLSEQRKAQEVERAHEEQTTSRKRQRLNSADPLEDLFTSAAIEQERKRLHDMESHLEAERASQRRLSNQWHAELVLRDDAANKREAELVERERDMENKIDEIRSKKTELGRLDNTAIENEIKQADLATQSLQLDRERAEYEEKMRTEERNLCDKAAHLQVKEEELAFLVPAYEACAQLMQDYSAVHGAVKYRTKQKEVLTGEIERMVKRRAAVSQSFQRLQAEVMAPPVEP